MTDDPHSPPAAGSATRGPLSGTALADLFFRPRWFFQSVNLAQTELGRARPAWDTFAPMLTGSWASFWTFVVLIGALGAVFIWYLGGWWYNLRLRWSGAGDFARREGRLVYTFAGLVPAIPGLAYVLGGTLLTTDYQTLWNADEAWALLLLAFPFWGVIVSYLGVRTRFAVRPGPARVWFLILPLLVYAIVIGVIGMLYAL